MNNTSNVTLETIVALCKRRGFVYPTAEIYSGLNGLYDFGPLGTLMKNNIKDAWAQSLMQLDKEILFIDGAILGPEAEWRASGHVEHFHDPMVDCTKCKKRYRADEIDLSAACPHCGSKNSWTEVRQFNMMFQTNVGASTENSSIAYLRPETAQAIFVNFKNILSTCRVKIPFGVGQIGKAFRNEITPKQFLFRVREFEQMEMEWFCKGNEASDFFAFWTIQRKQFFANIGLNPDRIRIRPHAPDELAHYSKECNDVEYQFPFGWKELEGIANRGNFDLTQHTIYSKKDLSVFDDETKETYIPHVVECSVGVGRLFLALLFDAYHEDSIEGETRIVLKLHPRIAPIKAACMPLSKQLSEPIEQLYKDIKSTGLSVTFDESGSIGKRYRRQDEIGTPFCITYDFESQTDHCVTIRDRDTLKQQRINLDQVLEYLRQTVHR
ncbi:MAG TPA: glycine--tRNA ligase [Candidatus Babeliales bacterium]|jgi:glycyl-tRNA synthetase|nr:glycine--tRNA ligase [Candidatus Babeliales bacterium]